VPNDRLFPELWSKLTKGPIEPASLGWLVFPYHHLEEKMSLTAFDRDSEK
jgi:hypothetical protein